MSNHTYLHPVCPSLTLPSSLSLLHTLSTTPCAARAISAPLHEINWPPTKDSASQITSGEKSTIAVIVTECVENPFKYVISPHGPACMAPNC